MNEPKLNCYTVTLSFAPGGPLVVNTLVATDPASAAAITMLGVCRQHLPAQDLIGVACHQLETEWLRWALRTIGGNRPHEAPVVSLVQPQGERLKDAYAAQARVGGPITLCPQHPGMLKINGVCPACADNDARLAHVAPVEPPESA